MLFILLRPFFLSYFYSVSLFFVSSHIRLVSFINLYFFCIYVVDCYQRICYRCKYFVTVCGNFIFSLDSKAVYFPCTVKYAGISLFPKNNSHQVSESKNIDKQQKIITRNTNIKRIKFIFTKVQHRFFSFDLPQ